MSGSHAPSDHFTVGQVVPEKGIRRYQRGRQKFVKLEDRQNHAQQKETKDKYRSAQMFLLNFPYGPILK